MSNPPGIGLKPWMQAPETRAVMAAVEVVTRYKR